MIFLEKTLKIAGFAQFRPVFAGFATLGQFWPVLAGHFLPGFGRSSSVLVGLDGLDHFRPV